MDLINVIKEIYWISTNNDKMKILNDEKFLIISDICREILDTELGFELKYTPTAFRRFV